MGAKCLHMGKLLEGQQSCLKDKMAWQRWIEKWAGMILLYINPWFCLQKQNEGLKNQVFMKTAKAFPWDCCCSITLNFYSRINETKILKGSPEHTEMLRTNLIGMKQGHSWVFILPAMLGTEHRFLSALAEGSLPHPQLHLFSIHLVLRFCFLIKTNVAQTCCVAEPTLNSWSFAFLFLNRILKTVCVLVAQTRLNPLGAQRGCEFKILLPTTSQGLVVGACTTTHRIIFIFFFKKYTQ